MNTPLVCDSGNTQSVLITSNMYRPNIGGIENSLYHLAQEYKALGYKTIIVTSDINSSGLQLPEFEQQEGIDIYRYRACSGRGVRGFSKHMANALTLYRRILREHRPSVVVCRFHLNLLLLRLAGCRRIAYLVPGVVKNETRASYEQDLKGLAKLRYRLSFVFHKWVQKKAVEQADRLFVFSQNMLEQVSELTPRTDIAITKPGVSLSRFYPLTTAKKLEGRQALGLATDKKVFLCIGRLVKAKGFEVAIRAMATSDADNCELWVLGDGPLTEHFQQLIVELGCEDRVRLLGRQLQPEDYYKVADFFVMSSLYEPLGQTILEGLASGLPIIAAPSSASVVTASNEIIDDKQNIFVDEHSVRAFGEGFVRAAKLSGDEYDYISQFNRQQAEIRFSWASLARELAAEMSEGQPGVERV